MHVGQLLRCFALDNMLHCHISLVTGASEQQSIMPKKKKKIVTVNEMCGHKGQENGSHGRPTSGSMKGTQNDNHRVKIMRMGTQLFIIYDPSKAASQSNHHMQRALPTHVRVPALLLWWADREESFQAAQ